MKKRNNSKTIQIDRIETDIKKGLSNVDVQMRQKARLSNSSKQKGSSYAGLILSEVFTYFNIVYMLITVVLIVCNHANQLTYLAVVVPNLIIGIWQKCRSKYNIDKLSLMVQEQAIVRRDGKMQKIDIADVVRDDIIEFAIGNQISADSIMLEGECEVNESMLTGESLPVKKIAGDRLYAGSFLTSGACVARVYDVGQDNYVEKLTSRAKRYNKPRSEILRTLNKIIMIMSIAIIPLAVLLYLRIENIVKVAGAMIGMIPSGMFLLTSTALAVSMVRLSRSNTLVQEMYCIEMLARVDTICMDKTGTITDGTMKVRSTSSVNGNFSEAQIQKIIAEMLGNVSNHNATSLALLDFFGETEKSDIIEYLPFSSDRKFFGINFEKDKCFVIGAPEYVVDLKNNQTLQNICNEQSRLGNRVLTLAQCPNPKGSLCDFDKSEGIPVAVIVIEDRVREDAISTIKYFKENGVTLKVISGDNPITVSEIAKKVGLEGAEKYISLQDMSIEQVEQIANKYNVFGRVSPQQKEALIRSIKREEHTVAMIGDGVNDILALRESDCSIAMGSGTDASKNVSHLILVDDNFSNMKKVVAEGRRCTNNLQGTGSMFLTKTFICLVLCIFSIVSSLEYPFNPNQLLLLEFFAIGLPGFFFALQQNTAIIKGKFLDNVLSKAFAQAFVGLLLCLPLYFLLFVQGIEQTSIHMMIIVLVTINSLIVLYRLGRPYNKFRLGVCISMTICLIVSFVFFTDFIGMCVLDVTPIGNILGIERVSKMQYLILLGEVLLIFPLQELIYMFTQKALNKWRNRKKKEQISN